jgi:hypothetical protein
MLLRCFVEMNNHQVPFGNLVAESALVLSAFLSRDRQQLENEGFGRDLLRDMHRCLKTLFRGSGEVILIVEEFYQREPAVLDRVRQLANSWSLPRF